jgi:drug/metabolite transporter (DMT)-like permease
MRRLAPADLVLLGITALWGTTFALIQQGLAHAGIFTFLAMRFAIGAVALAVLARFRIFAPRANLAGLLLGAMSFLGFALQTGGLRDTTAPRSAFLTGLTVVLVPVASSFMRKRADRSSIAALGIASVALGVATFGGPRVGPSLWAALIVLALVGLACVRALKPTLRVAICLAVAGLALMTRPGVSSGGTLRGDLLTLGCTVAFTCAILLSERITPRHPLFPMTFGHLVAMGLLSAAALPLAGIQFESCPPLWGSLLFCGVVASAVCIAGQTFAMQRSSATRAALIYSLEPVFAALFAYAWKGELLGRAELIGGALIISATLADPVMRLFTSSAEPALPAPSAENG